MCSGYIHLRGRPSLQCSSFDSASAGLYCLSSSGHSYAPQADTIFRIPLPPSTIVVLAPRRATMLAMLKEHNTRWIELIRMLIEQRRRKWGGWWEREWKIRGERVEMGLAGLPELTHPFAVPPTGRSAFEFTVREPGKSLVRQHDPSGMESKVKRGFETLKKPVFFPDYDVILLETVCIQVFDTTFSDFKLVYIYTDCDYWGWL